MAVPLRIPHDDHRPIGIFDSGVGGLSILREVRRQLPAENLIYVADQGHVPYGPRSIEQVRGFTVEIARWLLDQDAKLIIIACNTASAAGLYPCRETFPDTSFVGMEPAVKPAARDTQSGVIGVIATEATFQGELFASVVGRFAHDVRVEALACPEFVLLAEAGNTDSPDARATIRQCLTPLTEAGIDQLVLGCTHFAFLKDAIQAATGDGVTIVDPSAAIARQAGRVLADRGQRNRNGTPGIVRYYTSGDPARFAETASTLLGARVTDVRPLHWAGDATLLPPVPVERQP